MVATAVVTWAEVVTVLVSQEQAADWQAAAARVVVATVAVAKAAAERVEDLTEGWEGTWVGASDPERTEVVAKAKVVSAKARVAAWAAVAKVKVARAREEMEVEE